MNNKFGQFAWNCWKNEKPEMDKWVYIFWNDCGEQFMIKPAKYVSWEDDFYWCYVYIPDAPKIEKKLTLDDKVAELKCLLDQMMTSQSRLLDRIIRLENG